MIIIITPDALTDYGKKLALEELARDPRIPLVVRRTYQLSVQLADVVILLDAVEERYLVLKDRHGTRVPGVYHTKLLGNYLNTLT